MIIFNPDICHIQKQIDIIYEIYNNTSGIALDI